MTLPEQDWYVISNVNELDSPALVVYFDRVQENIRVLKSMIDDPLRLRPHIKTHKSKQVTQLLMQSGIAKFKCATIAEAEMLADCRVSGVLLAYQPVGPKLHRLVSLIKQYPETSFSCLVDNEDAARQIAGIAAGEGLIISVYLDLNTGMNRTGIPPGDAAIALYKLCFDLNGIRPVGLHLYDGHIRHEDFTERSRQCDESFNKAAQMSHALTQAGYSQPLMITGGSPTYSIHCKRSQVECSPGTFIYWDKGYKDLCPEQPFLPAALVITRVISMPDATRLCLDLGHKSVASENVLTRRVHFLNAPLLNPVSHSEEHLVIDAGHGHSFKIGDVLYGLPFHICPTNALYERVFTVENGRYTGEWPVEARDRKIKI
ncbi:MAG: D-TA family PLP-dependent enzyme [Chitinophagaceae bacterium]